MLKAIYRIATLDYAIRNRILLGVFLSFFAKVFEVIPDILLGLMIDTAIRKRHAFLVQYDIAIGPATVISLAGLILAFWLIYNLIQILSSIQWKQAARRIQYHLRMSLYSNLFDRRGSETLRELHRHTSLEIETVEVFFGRTLEEVIRVVFSAAIIGPLLFLILPKFLAYAFVPVPIAVLLCLYHQWRMNPRYAAVKKLNQHMQSEFDEFIQGASIVQDFQLKDRVFKRLEAIAQRLNDEHSTASNQTTSMLVMSRLPVQVGLLSILLHGSLLVYGEQLTFGAFAAAGFLTRKFLLPLSFLGGLLDAYMRGVKNVAAVSKRLDEVSNCTATSVPSHTTGNGNIVVRDLSLGYGNRKVIENLSFEFERDKLNVISGRTGVGKTTLLRHLLEKSGRSVIVAQQPILFSASVLDNITLFETEVSDETLAYALTFSLTDRFLSHLPEGLQTKVGPGGLKLSRGQIQSIVLARAIYTRPEILLLDEPTAGFDLETEKEFLRMLRVSSKGRVVVMASHRAQVLQEADAILELRRI